VLSIIETDDIEPFVQTAYAFDEVLIHKWHVIAGSGLNDCVKRSVQDLENCETLKFYAAYDADTTFFGYFGTQYAGAYMPTIFVMPGFRDRKDEFWSEIEKRTTPTWRAGIYTKNTPCMRFYAKKGVEVARLPTPGGEAAVFEFKRSA